MYVVAGEVSTVCVTVDDERGAYGNKNVRL
jgi:hypothetical protein